MPESKLAASIVEALKSDDDSDDDRFIGQANELDDDDKFESAVKFGGKGSGDYGHEGRPGERGGSSKEGSDGGKSTPAPKLSEKAQRAKDAHKLVDKTIQRYAEEHNEPQFAKAVGGKSLDDNEPVDVVMPSAGPREHGIELKTMVDNGNNKITMKRSAMELKAAWESKHKADIHTIVIDDQKVFNANGEGKHNVSQRVYYYRRGYGSFRVGTMQQVATVKELKALIAAKEKDLPVAAQRPRGQSRGKLAG